MPGPASPRQVEVTFVSPGAGTGHQATLCGTLLLPVAAGPVPLVVLLHGSGPQDRDETLPGVLAPDDAMDRIDGRVDGALAFVRPVTVFRDIAEALAPSGIAVFRYDKRTWLGTRASTCLPTPPLDPLSASIDDLVADAAAAIELLRRRPEIDGSRVYVVGHSEGAHVALALAAAPGVAGVASLAGSGRPIDVEIIAQIDRVVAYIRTLPAGADRERGLAAWEQKPAAARDVFARLRSGTFGAAETYLGAGRSYWLSWLALADRAGDMVAVSPVPVLLVGGTLDFNVPPESFEALRARARPIDTARLLAGHTHALTDASGGVARAEVSPLVTGAIADWIARRPN